MEIKLVDLFASTK